MLSKNLIDLENLSVKEILDIIDLANKIKANPSEYANACQGKILATLFYEPSTRTRMSFSTATSFTGVKTSFPLRPLALSGCVTTPVT